MKIIYENMAGEMVVITPAPMENFKFLRLTSPREMQEYSDRFKGGPERLALAIKKKNKTNDYIAKSYRANGVFVINENSWLNYISAVDIPENTPFEIVPDSAIPAGKEFRDAWKKNGRVVDTDMPKARAIHMDRIRKARNEELDQLDKDINKLEDFGGDATDMRVKRQVLRDIPANFSLASTTTPEELSALFPAELLARKGKAL